MANIIVSQLLYLDAVDPTKVSVLFCMIYDDFFIEEKEKENKQKESWIYSIW